MDQLRHEIKKWLKENKKSREWMAEKLGIKKATLDKWLSDKSIPELKRGLIRDLMVREGATSEAVPDRIVLKFSQAEMDLVKGEADRRGLSVEEWAMEIVRALSSIASRPR